MMYTLRLVKDSDWGFWQALHREGYETRIAELWGSWDEALQEEFARKEFEAAHDGQFVIVVDGMDAGYASWMWQNGVLVMNNLMVGADFRGKGLGGKVMADIIEMAAKRGEPVRLRTFVNNPARRLYERLGFVVTGDDGKHLTMVKET